jgi:hypothetical protein
MSTDIDSITLRNGAAALNNWRVKNPERDISLGNEAFRGLDLSGANLSNVTMISCEFIGCQLRHVNLSNSYLKRTRFINCDLTGASFFNSDLETTTFSKVNVDGACFNEARSLSRIEKFEIFPLPQTPPTYEDIVLPFCDRWLSWDRLRFMASIRIFVPAYASLTLSVLTLNAVAWINSGIGQLNIIAAKASDTRLPIITEVEPNWKYFGVVVSFLLLSISATAFLACPSRITEFSRERWLTELNQPEILYDHAAWRRPMLRIVCALSLIIGGAISLILLANGVVSQLQFVIISFLK